MTSPGRRSVAWLWTAVVAALLLAPIPALFGDLADEELGQFPFDKLAHAVLFLPLGWAWLDVATPERRPAGRAVAVLVALLLWGGAIELLQGATGWRRAEWADLAADALGLVCAAVVPRWWPFSALRGRGL